MKLHDAVASQLDIVCIGTTEWLVVHSLAENTMLGLTPDHRVVFVEPFGSIVTLARMARWQRRKRNRAIGLSQAGVNLWIYRPPPIGLPGVTRSRVISAVNGWILARLLRGVLRRLDFQRPILWSYLYNSASLLSRWQAGLKIYECGDEDSALARDETHRRLVKQLEAETCKAADLVFACTAELAAPRRLLNPHTYEVNCAADLDFFGRALASDTTIPEDIARLPGPIIGYLGGIDPWKMDIGLLTAIAQSHPEWSIVLVGYVWFGFDRQDLAHCTNIHILGPKEYDDFPRYLKGMDVCIMPFPLNDITRNGDALKLYEYLAGGRPVVSTDVPAARRLSDCVRIAPGPTEFIQAIEAALADGSEAAAARHETIQAHSWTVRNTQKLTLIGDYLARRASAASSGK